MSQVLAVLLEIPIPLLFSLPLATVLARPLHRSRVLLDRDYRVIPKATLRLLPFAEHANAHLLIGEVLSYEASVLVPACVKPNMELGTVPNSLSVLLGNVIVLTDGAAGLEVLRDMFREAAAFRADVLLFPPRV